MGAANSCNSCNSWLKIKPTVFTYLPVAGNRGFSRWNQYNLYNLWNLWLFSYLRKLSWVIIPAVRDIRRIKWCQLRKFLSHFSETDYSHSFPKQNCSFLFPFRISFQPHGRKNFNRTGRNFSSAIKCAANSCNSCNSWWKEYGHLVLISSLA